MCQGPEISDITAQVAKTSGYMELGMRASWWVALLTATMIRYTSDVNSKVVDHDESYDLLYQINI